MVLREDNPTAAIADADVLSFADASDSDNDKNTNATLLGDYIDARVGTITNKTIPDLKWKEPVRVATTVNGTLATAYENGDTIDGITLATGDRILLKDQSTGAENGIYTVNASGAPTRSTDWDGGTEAEGAIVLTREGTANGTKAFKVDTIGTITIGTTDIVITEFGGGGSSIHKYQIFGELNDLANTFPEYCSIMGTAFIGTRASAQSIVLRELTVKEIAFTVQTNSIDIDEDIALQDDASDVKTLTITAGLTGTFKSTDGDAVIAVDSLVNFRNLGLHSSGTLRIAGFVSEVTEPA